MNESAVPAKRGSGKRWLIIVAGILIAGAVAAVTYHLNRASGYNTLKTLVRNNNLQIDPRHPDVLIESASLSRLPRDLLSIPLLRDTLTEDFVFYYQHNADKLGLIGSLRRIIFEHNLELRDALIEELLDQPANVALWHDANGRLRHFMIEIRRGGLAKVLEPLAFAAADDSQLSKTKLSQIQVGGAGAAIYQLRYGGKSLLFASHDDKLLLMSGVDMMFDGEKHASDTTEVAQAVLAGNAPWAESFGLTPRAAQGGETAAPEHRIAVSANYLGFGYQRFMPAFAGVRFEMTGQGWNSFLALNDRDAAADTSFNFTPVWQAMPMGASFCVALPVARGVAEEMLGRVGGNEERAGVLAQHLTGAAGMCWYADSRLYTPLLVTRLDDAAGSQADDGLGALFDRTIGAPEKKAPQGVLPMRETQTEQAHSWRREVSSSYGQYNAGESEAGESMTARKFFRVTLAREGQTLLFSLDDRLVEKARQTLGGNFPPMAEVLPANAVVPLYLAPEGLSGLFRHEAFDSLPKDVEPIFYNAAQTLLVPKLEALAGHGSYALTLPADTSADDAWQWIPIEWRAL
ncbi:DUF2138 domain-containing protein [Enterobacillus tribolii]|uniref:Uncharacterized protein YfaA (DUF2138 family) n=1 Tax=Enterobacillus tribolii TaxID=1487935 RepID=A0A370Q6X4_9GAMM|nr:DUF2138 domain-containing protein [Enterobacillus tribolii]MBW7984894.1 DUF2138 domain-containing protein [Enterobacillus tribolii]RDK84106.1 uncharacterized protein YfaA (DUF2138 family) [Enterobacillus tribolii]